MAEGGLSVVDDISSNITENNEDVIVASLPSTKNTNNSKTSVTIGLSSALSLSKIGEAAVKGKQLK